jgi:hypothetical protein
MKDLETHPDILSHRESEKQSCGLEGSPDPSPGIFMDWKAYDALSIHDNLPFIGEVKAG